MIQNSQESEIFRCDKCGDVKKNKAGLNSHIKFCKGQKQANTKSAPVKKEEEVPQQLFYFTDVEFIMGKKLKSKSDAQKRKQKLKKRKTLIDNINDFRTVLAQKYDFDGQDLKVLPNTYRQTRLFQNPLNEYFQFANSKINTMKEGNRRETLDHFGKKYRNNIYNKIKLMIPPELLQVKTKNVFFRLQNANHQPLSFYVSNIEDIGKSIEQKINALSEKYESTDYSQFYSELFSEDLILEIISTTANDAMQALKSRHQLVKGSRQFNNTMIKNFYLFNPQTRLNCFYQAVIFYQYVINCLAQDRNEQYVIDNPEILFNRLDNSYALKKKLHPNTKAPTLDQCKESLKQLNIPVVYGEEELNPEEPAYMFIREGHATVLFNKKLAFGQKLFEIFKFREQKQTKKMIKPQKRQPEEKKLKILFGTYDFEWTYKNRDLQQEVDNCSNEEMKKKLKQKMETYNQRGNQCFEQVPYSYGILLDYKKDGEELYYRSGCDKKTNLKRFIGDIDKICFDAKTQGYQQIILFAHAGSKHDYPLIKKKLYDMCGEFNMFTKESDIATGQKVLSGRYIHNKTQIKIEFQDSLTWLQDSLDNLCKSFITDSKYHKSYVNHEIINYDNVEEQYKLQNIENYQYLDCKALLLIVKDFFSQICEETGIQCQNEYIYSPPSLSTKDYYFNYYKDEEQIEQIPTDEHRQYVRKAYMGGWSDLQTKRGLTKGKIISIDINSSYPYELTQKLPIGKYSKLNNINKKYQGEKLDYGVYRVLADSTNHTCQFPCLMTYDEGKLCASWVINSQIYCTNLAIEYAYKNGYDITIIDGYVSQKMGYPFKKYIETLYQKRLTYKTEMKKYKEGTAEYNKYNVKQGLCKLLMNSLYGKHGMKEIQESSSIIETDYIEFLAQIQEGNVLSFEEFNNFINYSGQKECNLEYINLFVAVFTTERARLHLHQIMEDMNTIGGKVLYHDTDSVYAEIGNVKEEDLQKFSKKHCDNKELGKCKFEMNDNLKCGCNYCDEFVTVAPKIYGMRCSKHNNQKLHLKGVRTRYVFDQGEFDKLNGTEKENYIAEKFTFDDLVDLSNGKSLEFIEKITYNRSNLLKDELVEHIKEVIQQKKTVKGEYDKQKTDIHGNIEPKVIKGITLLPEFNLSDIYEVFTKKEQIVDKYCDVEQLIDKGYEIIQFKHKRQETGAKKYAICRTQDYEKVCQLLLEKDQELHITMGDKIRPVFDIDCDLKKGKTEELYYKQIKIQQEKDEIQTKDKYATLKASIVKLLGITKAELKKNPDMIYIWDRSREEKISFHIHISGIEIDKAQLRTIVYKSLLSKKQAEELKDDGIDYKEMKSNPYIQCIDLNVYNKFHSLRINPDELQKTMVRPSNSSRIMTKINQLKYMESSALSQEIKTQILRKNMEEGQFAQDTVASLEDQMIQFVKDRGLEGKWKIRINEIKKFAKSIKVGMKRIDFRCKDKCLICKNKIHERDNNYYIMVDATKKISLGCYKNDSAK